MKKLFRSRKDRVLGGVCGGIGEYFNIDPVLIRLALIALTCRNPGFIFSYVIAWIFLPQNK